MKRMAYHLLAETLEEADAVFMNTCSIRDNAEQKILNRLVSLPLSSLASWVLLSVP